MDDIDAFVPPDFEPPDRLDHGAFRLRPLSIDFNERDHRAWTTSIDHIRRTPGFEGRRWPTPMSLADNGADLAQHAADFEARRGFTYTVLDPGEADVIGCVYIYPGPEPMTASVRSWVRESHGHLDATLARAVREWLTENWPFQAIHYAGRETDEEQSEGHQARSG